MSKVHLLHILILLSVSLSGCQIKPIENTRFEPTPSINPTSHLVEALSALSALPHGANNVEFIDWSQIKEYEGFEDFTSDVSQEQWFDFLKIAAQYHVIQGAYAIMDFKFHKDKWSWNTLDLVWEANVSISNPPSHVLKFRDGFNFESIINLFKKRDFAHQIYHGIDVYTHPVKFDTDWMPIGEFAILNTAIIPENNLMIMSIGEKFLFELIDTYQGRNTSLADSEPTLAVVKELDEPFAAFLSSDVCAVFGSEAMLATPALEFAQAQLVTQLANRPALHQYQSLGIGYKYVDNSPLGKIVMQFQKDEDAQNDFEGRRNLAANSMTIDKESQPYDQAYFTLLKSEIKNGQLILNVVPINYQPQRLLSMADRMDMMFATCP